MLTVSSPIFLTAAAQRLIDNRAAEIAISTAHRLRNASPIRTIEGILILLEIDDFVRSVAWMSAMLRIHLICYSIGLACFLACFSLASDGDVRDLQDRIQTVVKRTMPAIVAITEQKGNGSGAFSGVIVSTDGHILSVAHTVTPEALYTVHLNDGRRFQARGLGVCAEVDLGMIKISDSGSWPVAQMGQSANLKRGQPCVSISHPGSYDRRRGPVVRFGQIVAPISPMQGMVQTTALMEPGDSGGALFDLDGKLVAIHSQIQQPLKENYEVPVDSYRLYWEKLQVAERFEVERIPGLPVLGFRGRGSRQPAGVRVVEVEPQSAAQRAGLQLDDRIIALDGDRVDSWRSMAYAMMVKFLDGERTLSLTVKRQEDRHEIELDLSGQPATADQTSSDIQKSSAPDSSPAVHEAGNKLLKEKLSNVTTHFRELEERLDDCCVRISSHRDDRQSEITGWYVDTKGSLVSKSSAVLDDPKILLSGGEVIPLTVLARDESLDLVLLSGGSVGISIAILGQQNRSVSADDLGMWVISPSPVDDGEVGVLGSSTFHVPRSESRGYLGVGLETIDNRVQIASIERNGAARRAGIREGDIIQSIDGHQYSSHESVRNYLRVQLPEQDVRLELERDGEAIHKIVRLGNPPAPRHIAEAFDGGKSLRRDGFPQVLCHDAPLHPFECGGPVFDAQGRFVGVNIARFSRSRSYVIPAGAVRQFVANAPTK